MSETPREPMTPEEASVYERPARRQLWWGLLGFVAVVFLFVLVGADLRYRSSLDEPQPGTRIDVGVEQVLSDFGPLDSDIAGLRIVTLDGAGEAARYRVVFLNRDDASVYGIDVAAAAVGLVDAGPRAGSPVNFDIRIDLGRRGAITGLYRRDRGVHLQRYEAVLHALLAQSLVAQQAQAALAPGMAVSPLEDDRGIRESWSSVTD